MARISKSEIKERDEAIQLMIKLKHPDPYTETSAFIDSLPDSVVADRYDNEWTVDTKRQTMKVYFSSFDVGKDVYEYLVHQLKRYYVRRDRKNRTNK